MLYVLMYIWQLLTACVCWKKQFKVISIYLAGSLLLDILCQFFQWLQIYPKPYTGYGLLLWLFSSACYLLQPTLLTYLSGMACQSKTFKEVSLISFPAMMILIYCLYPWVAGLAMLRVFSAYFLSLCLFSSIALISQLKSQFGMQKILLLLCSLGGAAEFLLLNHFNFLHDYYLLNLGNGIFYLIILIVVWKHSKLKNVLPQ